MLRQERKERKMTLGDLARKLKLSVPYLSQIETGAKPVQDELVDTVIHELGLIGDDVNRIRRAAALSMSDYAIRLKSGASAEDRVLASTLASGFARLSHEKKEQLRRIMEDESRG
ncbi:helix-turn-helix transcriptional regulator [Sphingomonas sp. H39-1-10]|nr:helix-turn-helix transcriptional regulator [Sphingomonas pollutisoli]MDF0489227.1 helix-turn-helix transcriptional regulator [Sphingomonas pollutisoli]